MVLWLNSSHNQIQAADRIFKCLHTSDAGRFGDLQLPARQLGTSRKVHQYDWLKCWRRTGESRFWYPRTISENGVSTVKAYAWAETNVRQAKVFGVAHKRMAKRRDKKQRTHDIYEMVANQGSRRLRACITEHHSGRHRGAALSQCSVTQASERRGNAEEIKEAIRKRRLMEISESPPKTSETVINADSSHPPANCRIAENLHQPKKTGMSKPSDWFAIKVKNHRARI